MGRFDSCPCHSGNKATIKQQGVVMEGTVSFEYHVKQYSNGVDLICNVTFEGKLPINLGTGLLKLTNDEEKEVRELFDKDSFKGVHFGSYCERTKVGQLFFQVTRLIKPYESASFRDIQSAWKGLRRDARDYGRKLHTVLKKRESSDMAKAIASKPESEQITFKSYMF